MSRKASSRDYVPSLADVSITPASPRCSASWQASENSTSRLSSARSTLFPTSRMLQEVSSGALFMKFSTWLEIAVNESLLVTS